MDVKSFSDSSPKSSHQVAAAQLAMLVDPSKILKSKINPKLLVYGFVAKGSITFLVLLTLHIALESEDDRQRYQIYFLLVAYSFELALIILWLFFGKDLQNRIITVVAFLVEGQGESLTSVKLLQLARNIHKVGLLLVVCFVGQMINVTFS